MTFQPSRAVTITAAVSLAVGMSLLAGGPAQAAKNCTREQHKEFGTSGYDTDVYLGLCADHLSSDANAWYASADGYWIDGGGVRKFDNFDIRIRLERNNKNVKTVTCDLTAEINRAGNGTIQCQTKIHRTTSNNGLSADATVSYNLDADGAGGKRWHLKGSPEW